MVVFNSLFFAYKEAICSNKYKFTFITSVITAQLFLKIFLMIFQVFLISEI